MDAHASGILLPKGVEDEPPIPDLIQSKSVVPKLDLCDCLHRHCTVIHHDNVAAEASWFGLRLLRAEVQQDNNVRSLFAG